MFPKYCQVCYETDPSKLKRCPECKFSSFCKEGDCQVKAEANPDIHKKYCADKKIAFLCRRDYQFQTIFKMMPKTLSLTTFFQSNPENTCDIFKLIEHISGEKFIRHPENRKDMDSCSTVCQFTFTASIIYALEKAKLLNENRKSLNIHIVGAQNETDCFTKDTLGLFYVFLPKLESFKISFIGPDMIPIRQSEEIDFHGRTIKVEYCFSFYEDFPKPKPDFIMCLNSGFNDYPWGENPIPDMPRFYTLEPGTPDTDWVRGMKKILKHRVPFAFTTFIKAEIYDDATFVKRVAEHMNVYKDLTGVVLGPNPFMDLRPFQNADLSSEEPLLYANQRICVVNWKEFLGEDFKDLKTEFEKKIE